MSCCNLYESIILKHTSTHAGDYRGGQLVIMNYVCDLDNSTNAFELLLCSLSNLRDIMSK